MADAERIARRLESLGHRKAEQPEEANIIVLNACAVRQAAIDRVYSRIEKFSRLKTHDSRQKIIVSGCILPKDKKNFLAQGIEIWHPDEYFDLVPARHASDSVAGGPIHSANIPIMTGCDNFCSYCAVPFTRGRERSRKAKEIIKDIKSALKNNIKEIWLLGQNVNSYKSKNINFPKLLRLVNAIPGDFWIRFTSPHPKDFLARHSSEGATAGGDDLIRAMKECEKFPHYLNLPAQSGNNEILKKMNRPYTAGHYKKLIKKIRKAMPDIAISTDAIVGFPGETKKQFQDTCKLFREVKFDMAFISEYSPRPGTLAAKKFKDDVPAKEKIRRKNELNEILKKTAFANNKKLVGKTVRVLNSRTAGNKLVKIANLDIASPSDFINIKITKAEPWKLWGEIVR